MKKSKRILMMIGFYFLSFTWGFKGTSKYNNAIEAQAYYREENTKIKNRLTHVQKR